MTKEQQNWLLIALGVFALLYLLPRMTAGAVRPVPLSTTNALGTTFDQTSD